MAYTLPTFNLTCLIWRQTTGGPPAPPDVSTMCNLAAGRRTFPSAGIVDRTGFTSNYMFVLLPKLTDVQDYFSNSVGGDFVEIPAGSGRFYLVAQVDDIGKGFPNEHRYAMVFKTNFFGDWPAPIP